MKKKRPFNKDIFNEIFNDIFGDKNFPFKNSTFFTSFSTSFSSSSDADNFDDEGFPKDDDKNYNKTVEVSETPTHTVTHEVWVSVNGTSRFERTRRTTKGNGDTLPTKEELQIQLDAAIKAQEFEKACELRDQIKNMK